MLCSQPKQTWCMMHSWFYLCMCHQAQPLLTCQPFRLQLTVVCAVLLPLPLLLLSCCRQAAV